MKKAVFLGKVLKEVSFSEDAVGLTFSDGGGLTIYNECQFLPAFEPKGCLGKTVISEKWGSLGIQIELCGGVRIEVSLEDEGWNGPEAMVYLSPEGQYMVVNAPPEEVEIFRNELK